jgi:ketosteroid isomerase-like protein
VIGLLFSITLFVTTAQAGDATAAIDAYRAAIVAGDRPALERLLHSDFVITSGDGQLRDKAGELADLVADGFKVHEFRLDDARVRTIGTTAIATGILRWRMTFEGRESSIERRTTMTWINDGGRWQLVAQHVARVK